MNFIPKSKSKPNKNSKRQKMLKEKDKQIDAEYSLEKELKQILKRLEKYGNTICTQRLAKKFRTNKNIELYFASYGIDVHVRTSHEDEMKITIIELGKCKETRKRRIP